MFENIPKNWEKVALENLLEYEQPTNYIVASEEYNDSYPTPVLTAGKSFILGYTNETEGIYQNTPVIIFDDFTTESKFVDFEFKVKSSAMKILKAKDNDTLKYLYYLMQILPFNNTQHKRYWISEYSKIKIGIPKDINEVKEIVKVLDAASEIIRLRTACIESAQFLIPALFQEMFDISQYPLLKLDEICEVKGGKRLPKGCNLQEEKTEHPYIRVTNFKNNNIDIKDLKYISNDVFEQIKRYTISCNDIYMSIAGTIGLVGEIPNELDNANLTENAAKLILKNNSFNKKFLIHCLSSGFLQKQISEATVGVGVPKLALIRILNLKLPNVPTEQQELFAEKVQEIEAYIKTQQVELENAKTMFQSLLHHSFTGELTRRAYGE